LKLKQSIIVTKNKVKTLGLTLKVTLELSKIKLVNPLSLFIKIGIVFFDIF